VHQRPGAGICQLHGDAEKTVDSTVLAPAGADWHQRTMALVRMCGCTARVQHTYLTASSSNQGGVLSMHCA